MNSLNNLGIKFTSDYLLQGNNIDKVKLLNKLKIKNACFELRDDKKSYDLDTIFKNYSGNTIFHLPTISYNLSNLKEIENLVRNLILNKVNLVTINSSNLTMEEFEFSQPDEQKQYFSNIVDGIAALAANKIVVAIENPIYNGNSSGHYGQGLNNLTDIVVYARKKLINTYLFNEKDANYYIGISFNINNLLNNSSIEDVNKWFLVLKNNIKCIKYSSGTFDDLSNVVLKNCLEYKIDVPILIQEKSELELIVDKFNNYINIYKKFNDENGIIEEKEELEITTNQDGFTNIIVASIIVITVVIWILMVLVKVAK